MTTETKNEPKPWKSGDAINPEGIDGGEESVIREIIKMLSYVLNHNQNPRKVKLDVADLERVIDLAKGLAADLSKLSSNAADAENWIDEYGNVNVHDTLDTLKEALTDNLAPWVWSEALEAAEKGDTIRVRKVFELS